MLNNKKTYVLPSHIAAALASERSEFIRIFAKEVKNGSVVPSQDEFLEILDLLSDLMDDNIKLESIRNNSLIALQETMVELGGSRKKIATALVKLQQTCDGLTEDKSGE